MALFTMTWYTHEGGYEVVTKSDGVRYVACRTPLSEVRPYRPLKQPGLFREFTALGSEDDILQFASKYGHLFGIPPLGGTGLTQGGSGYEKLEDWQQQIKSMRSALELYEFCRELVVDKLGYPKPSENQRPYEFEVDNQKK